MIRFVQDLFAKLKRKCKDYLPVRQESDECGIKSKATLSGNATDMEWETEVAIYKHRRSSSSAQ